MHGFDWVLSDVEGTTTPIAFVRDVLFPYARTALPELITARADDRTVAACLAEIARLAPGISPAVALARWMDDDAKVTPLKDLQGIAWQDGYESGAIKGAIYPDVPPALRAWTSAGIRIGIYSSGSVRAQRLIFGHSDQGDLSGLISANFDTTIGTKREVASYIAIADALGSAATRILFLSDIAAELDAAASAGMRTCQLVRPQDGTLATDAHPKAADFSEITGLFTLA